ncbi:sulfite exporter TauE/SafE family protein [Candidatus Berkiella cookevillensis]|uniref:Probable membrane transporter protein n=1 Tax=Candidatus Berkiella cookevillensis TaxID=437022 RepID=A0A0Q9YM74_9GAMM|nr:sulfite exporter TauE/SafE family protein [Candidatus Berkiella cookevillensis]MCS5709551.1 sulfite exporter TauE/SafE family protein [Candidatus Berkiella cookevillensis]
MIYIFAVVIGAFSGLLSGLLGIGGGVAVVPLLSYAFMIAHVSIPADMVMHYAVGTSLATMVFSTLSASFFQHKKGAVLWPLFWYIAPGTVLGGLLGGFIADSFSSHFLKVCFAAFCAFISLLFFRKERVERSPEDKQSLRIPKCVLTVIGVFIGTIAGMLGVGGGVLLIPLLVALHFSLPQASALSVSCTLPTVIAGTVSAIYFGWDAPPIDLPSIGYVIWPIALTQGVVSVLTAKLGVHITHTLPRYYLRKLFAILLLCIAWLMLAV